MTVTLTATYREFLESATADLIDKLVTEEFELQPMLEFIDENSESDFVDYYPLYVELGEEYGYEAVDAFVKLNYVGDLQSFSDAYLGEYCSHARMAQDYFEDETERLDYRISIDWDETGDYLVMHEVDCVDSYYFRHTY